MKTALLTMSCLAIALAVPAEEWPQYDANPFVISLDIPGPEDSAGGVIAADLDNDGLMDYAVTVPGHIAAYAHSGVKLWVKETPVRVGGSSEREGLPGHNGPGIVADDIDGDGATEALYLTNDNALHVVNGANGSEEWSAALPAQPGAERWEHLALASLRKPGSADLVLQATNAEGYRTGRYVAGFALDALQRGDAEPLWKRDDYLACAHNGVRIADLNGDGRDEIIGPMLLHPDGEVAFTVPVKGHIDSVFVADVKPDLPGHEVVALEEGGGNRVFLYTLDKLLWEAHYQHWEPQNAAVGEFDLDRPGLEVWCRSRFNTHQKPFVFDSGGQLILQYEMDDVAPAGWTDSGVEVIYDIYWDDPQKQLAAAKERHTSGDIAVFRPIGGAFVTQADEKADRFYVVDVSGDWREEGVVLNGNELRIYHNPAPAEGARPRLWQDPNYRKAKQTYNYYSP